MSNETLACFESGENKLRVEAIEFEVLGNLRTDFTLMTYTNQVSRNHRKAEPEGDDASRVNDGPPHGQ